MHVHECVKESRCPFLSKVIVKANSVTSRQKRKILLDAKPAILDSLYRGNGQARLAEECGVGKSTISNTKKSEKKIRGYITVLEFVPSVRKYLCGSSLPPKALLLLDNAISHPYIDVLQSSNKNISAMYLPAMYLPANTTSLIQPMDQGVLVTLKRHLQKSSAEKLPFLDEEGHSMVSFIKTINI